MSIHDSIPSFARDVLELFSGPLKEVRFPDLDAALLARHAGAVEEAQREVSRIEDELSEARAVVADKAQALTVAAQRALAYARVYAEGKDELEARVSAVTERKPSASAEPAKKRGRPKRSDSDPSLFDAESATEDAPQLM
jgi:hypothetical protein